MTLPLEGFRILQLGPAIASPYAASVCGSLGAEVIKIECRRRPDNMRFASGVDPAPNPLDGSLLFNGINLNTRSALLDLKVAEGRALFLDLAQTADAVLENFSAGMLDSFGVGYETLRRRRPDLVMVSLSGFGATGPMRDCVAYGVVLEGLAGMMHVNGYADGPPVETPFTYNDYVSALYGAHLVTAALRRRMQTGEGFYADFSEAEITLHLVHQGVLDWMVNGHQQERRGNRDDGFAVHGCFPSRGDDQWIAIVAGTEEEWQGLCRVLGRDDWLGDPGLASHEGRLARRTEIEAGIAEWTRGRTKQDAAQALQHAGVPAGPANVVYEMLEDRHIQARQVWTPDALHPHTKGRLVAPLPLRMTGVSRDIRRPSPPWGEATAYVMREVLGLPEAEVVRLSKSGVLT